MSLEGRSAIMQAVIAAALDQLTAAEQADVIRWMNVTYVEAYERKPKLTDREQRVIRLHAAGHGSRAISEMLHCSYTTVARDLRALEARLGASSPQHLIVIAARAGLL